MDKDTGQGSRAVSASPPDEDKTPEQLQEEIAETREQLGDTVEALAGKADVKGQAQQKITDFKGTADQKRQEFTAKLKSATPDGAASGAQQVATRAKQDPLPFAVGGAFLVGFVLGRISSS